MFPLVALD